MNPLLRNAKPIAPLVATGGEELRPLESDLQPQWYAIYTCANCEKRVKEQLDRRLVESFLPLYDSMRRWKDRRVLLQLPLFPSYLFVRVAPRDRLQVLQVPGIARFVGFGGRAYALPESDVQALQRIAPGGFHASPHPYLTK